MDCGCTVQHIEWGEVEIEYCPLHKSASDMYEALKRLYKMFGGECGGCIKTENTLLEVQDALAKAEGKE